MAKGNRQAGPTGAAASGFTFIGLLYIVAVAGIGLAAVGHLWHLEMRREQESQLLFAGEEIRRAIVGYAEGTPGGQQQFPPSLEDLLDDRRHPITRRYLRRIYLDPLTGNGDWELIRNADGGILALHSRATYRPIKRAGFSPRHAAFAQAKSYREWVFSAMTPSPLGEPAGSLRPGKSPGAAYPTERSFATPSQRAIDLVRDVAADPLPSQRPAACAGQHRIDGQICALAGMHHGHKVESRCRESAAERLTACRDATSVTLIPLVLSAP